MSSLTIRLINDGGVCRLLSAFVEHKMKIFDYSRKARYLFYCMFFFRYFVNDFSTTRGQIHAKFCMRAYSGSEYVFSSFGGWRPPAGGKRGKLHFRYYGSQWGIFAFCRFLSDISATRARIHTKYYLCRDNVCRRAPSPCGIHRPLGGGGRGS